MRGESELQRAERAKASEASQSERKQAVVYLKLGTRQTQKPNITQTDACTYHRLKTVYRTENILGQETVDRGTRGEEEGGPGLEA